MKMFIDSDDAGDKMTRWSRKIVIIQINTTWKSWHWKKKSTVEILVFVAEFVAMK